MKKFSVLILCILFFPLSSCFHQKEVKINYTALACSGTSADSTYSGGTLTRIHSEDNSPNTYESVSVRSGVMMDYMVHTSDSSPKALLILIAGGQLNAQIEGIVGSQATYASGNFLVRSAHLFAKQGYKVVTIDRPNDYLGFLTETGTKGRDLDSYRISTKHFQDLEAIIAAENTNPGLPVVIAGTSRGTISAVAQANLANYIILTAPLTSGKGSPIGTTGVLASNLGSKPVYMVWHERDDCVVSTPADENILAGNISNVTAYKVSGGIDHPELSSRTSNQGCDGGKTHHGFLGIESCVVESATSWLNAQLQL